MLSRVAETIYWMSRYAERAANVARFVEVNFYMTLDHADGAQQWSPLVSVTGDEKLFLDRYGEPDRDRVLEFLFFDPEYPSSAFSCLRAARENARTVREIISTDMWEQINSAYLFVRQTPKGQRDTIYRNPHDFCRALRSASTLFGGLAHDTMSHGEALQFFRLGRTLERADSTSRILDVKYFIILRTMGAIGTPEDDLQWSALLASSSALEAYRQQYGQLLPRHVLEFLILDRAFPRAIRACLLQAEAAVAIISGTAPGIFVDSAGEALGRICADLARTGVDDILGFGLHEYLDDIQLRFNEVDREVHSAFFALTQPLQSQEQVHQ